MKKLIYCTLLIPVLSHSQVSSFKDYSADLEQKTDGLITAKHLTKSEISSLSIKGTQITSSTEKNLSSTNIQELLKFDLEALSKKHPAPDLLTSKILFDGSRTQDKNSGFVLPYTPIKDWMGLSHPPVKELPNNISTVNKRYSLEPGTNVQSSSFQKKLDSITNSSLATGNKLTLIKNKEIHEEKMKLLESSQKYFWGAVFLIRCDQYTMPFFEKMIEKQNAGLDVRLMIDRMGSVVNGGKCFKKLKKLGLNIHRVNKSLRTIIRETKKFGKRKSTAFHPKFWINESNTGIVDGVNLMNIHVETTDHNHMYKDTGVKVKGPTATDLKKTYISMWKEYIDKADDFLVQKEKDLDIEIQNQAEKALRGEALYKEEKVPEGSCRFSWQDPQLDNHSTSEAMIEMLKASESYIALTPLEYFLEKDHKIESTYTRFLQALDNKVRNENVALDYIVNRHGTWTFGEEFNSEGQYKDHGKSKIGKMISRKYKNWLHEIGYAKVTSYIQDLKKSNPEARGWFHYVFNHSKLLMVDNALTAIGSHNMNDRSFLSDIEAMLICVDPNLAKDVNRMLTKDMMNSISIATSKK